MYKFSVDRAEDIDVQRIIDECVEEEDASAILVTGANALLLLRQDFLDKFNMADQQVVACRRLYAEWGYSIINIEQVDVSSVKFSAIHLKINPEALSLSGWRGLAIPKKDANAAVQQLLKARKFQRSIEVKVHVL